MEAQGPCWWQGELSVPTWVEVLHTTVQQADVQAAEMDGVVEARDDHAPHAGQDAHQDIGGEEQEGDDVQGTPGRDTNPWMALPGKTPANPNLPAPPVSG